MILRAPLVENNHMHRCRRRRIPDTNAASHYVLPTSSDADRKRKNIYCGTSAFRITTKDETLFAYNEAEKAEIIEKLGTTKYTLQRSKGLRENQPDMMWRTTMNPETRRLIKITATDTEQTINMFETLLGDDLNARKTFIAQNTDRYMDQAIYSGRNTMLRRA